ncbi:MAG: VCBS repeat-containing protein [Planctomycetota bacterium]|nr:MAG: VCBS repeat-containing protein [Planctomycetota bacterium]
MLSTPLHYLPLLLLLPGAQQPLDPAAAGPRGVDVPLSLFTNADWPAGLELGEATGISFGDYDGDGWSDLFAFTSANLWRNVAGQTWEYAADLDALLPAAGARYGSSFGDYDNDGLPDIGCEPRRGPGDTCFHLLHNLGGGPNFLDVAGDPAVLDFQPCQADSETIGWADVDGDADLDMFLPIYPPSVSSIGNKFFHNRGPTGPGGAYRFTEEAVAAGLDNPDGNARPEGVFFFDADDDGDLDLYSNGALYQNLSRFDAPRFEYLEADSSGIRNRNIVDEGVFFPDYDRDGDYDLLISFTNSRGLRIYESYGDGSYFATDTAIIESYLDGAAYGLSVADWDNDGDMDFGAANTFRRNLHADTGARQFLLASNQVNPDHLRSAAPAWADWDQDGDTDLAIGNGMFGSYLYQNDSYDAATPWKQRRHLRVRVVRDSPALARGLETEYGASVEVLVHGEENGPRRQQVVSSASGYINQNEYTLAFALPSVEARFDLRVDFPSLPEAGFQRVDKFVNPVLGNLRLASLDDAREIVVYRSGKVVIRGCAFEPLPLDPRLVASTGGLILPAQSVPLPDPTPATSAYEYVGLEISTAAAAGPLRIADIAVDGLLAAPPVCEGRAANLRLWDVTDPLRPFPVPFGLLHRSMDPRNRRAHFPVDLRLEPGRLYRLVALVQSYRATPIAGPVDHGAFQINGGLHFSDPQACKGRGVVRSALDPGNVYLSVRVSTDGARHWADLGNASHAPLQLTASGDPRAGSPITLQLQGAPPLAPVRVVAGGAVACLRHGDAVLVPEPDFLLPAGTTDAAGRLTMTGKWPYFLERGAPLVLQAAVADAGSPAGFVLSNALATLSED